LARALDGDGPAPWEWWVSRLCEEFGCLPSQAVIEWEAAPAGLLEDICEMRAYARARAAYQQAQQMDDGPEKTRIMRDPLVALAMAYEFEALQERRQHGG